MTRAVLARVADDAARVLRTVTTIYLVTLTLQVAGGLL